MKVITISGFKGGTGKTTLAALLSIAATQAGVRTAAMDLDRNTRNLFNFLSLRKQAGLEAPDHVMLMDVQPSFGSPKYNGRLKSLIEMAREDGYELLVIDTSSGNHDDLYEAHLLADVILTPMNESPADLHGLFTPSDGKNAPQINYRDLVDNVRFDRARAGLPKQKWHVCLNRLSPLPTKLGQLINVQIEALAQEAGFENVWRVTDRVVHRSISLSGHTVFDPRKDNKLTMSELSGRSELRAILSIIDDETPVQLAA